MSFSSFCGKDIRPVNLTQKVSDSVQRAMLADVPDIVISTPARVVSNVNNSALSLDHLTQLVIDEADLVLSYGYEDDINALAKAVPRGVQTFLMSATLTSEVDTLKGLFCRNPVILKLTETEDEGGGISQFAVRCAEDEKFLLTYVIFKLQLVKGKCIIFVGDIDRCYRLKLFLEQFGIKSCVLNSELPANSRIHVVQEFNKGVYDIIIAADDQEVLGTKRLKRHPQSRMPITTRMMRMLRLNSKNPATRRPNQPKTHNPKATKSRNYPANKKTMVSLAASTSRTLPAS